jgi:hypothetical protein
MSTHTGSLYKGLFIIYREGMENFMAKLFMPLLERG